VRAGCDSVSADLWLLVTPQIIARIHSPNTGVRDSVNRLLAQVARSHPQVRTPCPKHAPHTCPHARHKSSRAFTRQTRA
jgi:phosphatidylinositol kinase/protein kinase (PI-3  family)